MAGEWNVVRGAGKATRTADRTYEDRQGAFTRPPYQGHYQRGPQYDGRRPVNRGDFEQRGWRTDQPWRREVPTFNRGPGRQDQWRSDQVHQPRQAAGPVQPSGELGQILTMMKAMQVSIAALEAKQAPTTRETDQDQRPSGAAASQPRDRPGPGKQVGNFSVPNLGPTTRPTINRNGNDDGSNRNSTPNLGHSTTINRNVSSTVNRNGNSSRINSNMHLSSARRDPPTEPEMSTNPDFAGLCKSMFRLVQ